MTTVRNRPQFNGADVEKIVQRYYGMEVVAEELPGERDQNFLVTGVSGTRFVLKIANPSDSLDVLAFQNQALERISSRDDSLPVPKVVPTITGRNVAEVIETSDTGYFIRLMTHLPGKPLAQVSNHSPALIFSLGNIFARLDKALIGYWHPVAERKLIWSIFQADRIIGENIAFIQNVERRNIVAYFLEEFKSVTLPALKYLRRGVIQNDGNDYNILVTEQSEGAQFISGLIDFGDMVEGPYIYEPAVIAAYVMMDKKDPIGTALQVLTGYHEVFPLTTQEIEYLFNLICVRLCTSVTLSAVQQKQVPDNEYLSISQSAAWRLLEKLIGMDPQKASERFRTACKIGSSKLQLSSSEILRIRQQNLGPTLSIAYKKPLTIVRGFQQYLYDDQGRAYLDAVNNVPHVGHCHPKVVRAGQNQMAVLNTNTRYLHENLVLLSQRLCATLPEPLSVCYFVCTGSEANELALRMAQTHTGGSDFIVIDGAYHGNTNALVNISPYKFDGSGGRGSPDYVHKVLMPDTYRGLYKAEDPDVGRKYASQVYQALVDLNYADRRIAAFIHESLLGCGGQIVLPDGYLKYVYDYVRSAGGVCIADEVQVGLGRVGTHFWGFETQDVIPDIVTIGKPMGNGHPLAAVVTTPEIARSFNNGMEYFNTFGGNPVSCAIGLAVLDVIEEEKLQHRALRVGMRLKEGLARLKERHELIGDVRGLGLFLGIELVSNQNTLEPAYKEASAIVEGMKDEGILISTDGPLHNVLKIKPPLVFSESNADQFVDSLDRVMTTIG